MAGKGGAMPGAGRKPKPTAVANADGVAIGDNPQDFLIQVMQGKVNPSPAQLTAALAAARNVAAASGKKGQQKDKAGKIAQGKFAPGAAPLRVVNG